MRFVAAALLACPLFDAEGANKIGSMDIGKVATFAPSQLPPWMIRKAWRGPRRTSARGTIHEAARPD